MEQHTNQGRINAFVLQFVPLRFQRYFQNLSWLFFEKIFSLFVAMIVGIYIARYLQPERYGLLNYAMSFVGMFSAFSTLGLDQIVVRELTKDLDRKNVFLGTSFLLKFLGSLCLIVVLFVVLIFMHNDNYTNTLIIIIALAEIFKAFDIISYYYQAKILSKFVVQVQIIVNLFTSVVKVLMVYFHASLTSFALIVLISAVLNALGYIYTYKKTDGKIFNWMFDRALTWSLLKESWPLTLYGIALHTQARIDQVMLGRMLNNYEVGQYSVALKIIEIFGFIPMVVMSTFSPAITKAKTLSQQLYDDRLINFYRLMFLIFVLIALPLYLFADSIIVFLYGIEYKAAGVLLSLFAIRLFFTNMGVGKSVFIVNESLFKYSLMATVIGASVNISINYFLIPKYASIGAIIATIISFTVSIFLLDFFFTKTRRNQMLMFKGIFSFWRLNHVV